MNPTSIDFLACLKKANVNITELWKVESNQTDKLDAARDQYEAAIEHSGDTVAPIKLLEDNVSLNLALSHAIGFKINEVNKRNSDDKMEENPPNRRLKLFLDKGVEDEFVETGNIVFIYTSKIDVDEATSINYVESFYVLLIPGKYECDKSDYYIAKTRLIKVDKNKLPAIEKEYVWAFVEKTDESIEKVVDKLQELCYQTATVETCTAEIIYNAGIGTYIMAQHDKYPTTINYTLESPSEITIVQHVLNINKIGLLLIAVENPRKESKTAASLTQLAEFLSKIQDKFGEC
ncbi:unnamed protein product [Rotaria sp. Silwood2]|nr:unnamed protein product [Rotaria sp. Silwood2]CAF2835606.1 unnamed protein product [Rotaria sp. Silwood2]CAF3093231.1 unnamed protein product [Rotaria sp. Silwood2]CAF3159160.1 unnamed protein product [Rotaria sp. Silwood2]CAF4026592.1 unnamed protein product [Rotaria sp. Silwood2]